MVAPAGAAAQPLRSRKWRRISMNFRPCAVMLSLARKKLLPGLVAGVVLGLIVGAHLNSAIPEVRATSAQALGGSWVVSRTLTGGSPEPPNVVASFIADGVAIRSAPVQQAAPPALGGAKLLINTTHGEWMRTDDGRYALTFIGLAFDDSGKLLATQRVRAAVQVSDSQEEFSGPFEVEFIGDDGDVLATSTGTAHGTRIHAQLPD
jgi:hypothetical protein